MSGLHPTAYQFAHHRVIDGEKHLIWGNGIGDIDPILAGTPEYFEALADRNWQSNALADEGEADMINVYFRTQAKRASLFGRLYNDTPLETDTLATLTGEVTGTGYAAVTFTNADANWGAPSLNAGDMQSTSNVYTFTAGGAWTAATHLVLATVATGTAGLHVIFSALSATRTLANTDTLDVSATVKLA